MGAASGNVETYEFTDVDRSLSTGATLRGAAWHRTSDTVAVALVVNDVSAARQRFLAAGGLGLLVGDGRLPHPGHEQILEAYYSVALGAYAHVTLDFQRIANPAFNRDRGPVPVFAVRLHAQR